MPDHLGAMRRTVTQLARLGKLHGVVYGLAVPVLVALWTGLHADLTAVHWAAFWVPLVLAIGLSGSTAWLLNDALLKPEVYLEIEEERKSSANLEDQVRFLSDVQEYSLSAFSISVNAAVSADRQPRHLQETIEEICETALENSDGLFGFGARERWSMTLYVHNPRDNQLYAIWRRKAKRHPASEKGRSWPVGNGHVGIAFAQAEAKICSDSRLEGAGELISAGRHARCYDQVVYASFVSMPIMRGGIEPSDPYGVLVVTSDVPGRFDQGSALPLRHAAAAIAALIELAYSKDDLQAMCDSTATSPPPT